MSKYRLLAPVSGMLPVAIYALGAAIAVAVVGRQPEFALVGGSPAVLGAEVAAGALLLLVALVLWQPHARLPVLLIAAALLWPPAEWNTPAAGSAFTAGLLLYAAWPPLLAAAALRGPDERKLTRPATAVLAIAFVTGIGVLGLASALVFDPRAQGCADCPANHVLVAGSAGAWHDLGRAGLALSAAWTVVFVALAASRLARSSPRRRRLVAPVLVPAAAAVLLFGIDALHGMRRGFVSGDPTDRALRAGEIGALALMAVGAAWGLVRARQRRAALGRLVVDLGTWSAPGALRERLAAMVGDPTLDVLYALDDGGGWVDADGRTAPLSPADGRRVTRITAAGRDIAAVVHRADLLDDPEQVAQIALIARLALEHERLQAIRRAQLEALRASRARIVASADGERRRLERDLHDGAQQRLVTLAVGIRLARRAQAAAGDPVRERELAGAEAEVLAAVGDLRRLAHGLFPTVLDTEGLTAAIELLAESEPRLVLGALPDERCDAPVESAAYYLVGQALRMAGSGDVSVEASRRDRRLLLEARATSGFTELPVRVEDRIGAVGGSVQADSNVVRADLPCGS